MARIIVFEKVDGLTCITVDGVLVEAVAHPNYRLRQTNSDHNIRITDPDDTNLIIDIDTLVDTVKNGAVTLSGTATAIIRALGTVFLNAGDVPTDLTGYATDAELASAITGVTASSVGLGNANNVSDVNKPVSTAQATAIALKAPTASPAFTGTPTAPTAPLGTNTTQLASTAFVQAAEKNGPFILGLQALGSTIKANPIGLMMPTLGRALTGGLIYYAPCYVSVGATLTGIKVDMVIQGVYTGASYNGVGLYSVAGGTLTLVASSTNNATLWAAAIGPLTIPFTTPYVATSAGVYYTAVMYAQSAQTTAPQLYAGTIDVSVGSLDFSNGHKLSGSTSGNSALPASLAASSISIAAGIMWTLLY